MSFVAIRETLERRGPTWLRRSGGPESAGRDAAAQAEAAAQLRASSYAEVRLIRCDVRGGVLTLRGRVSSFFHRQMAVAAVRRAKVVGDIRDELEVETE